MQETACDMQHATDDVQETACDVQHAPDDAQTALVRLPRSGSRCTVAPRKAFELPTYLLRRQLGLHLRRLVERLLGAVLGLGLRRRLVGRLGLQRLAVCAGLLVVCVHL
jgi:hypothetical protein